MIEDAIIIDIEKLKREVVERLKPLDPEKIILFGSYAHGKSHTYSDVDLYVVTKDNFIPQSYAVKREIVRKVSRQIKDIREKISIDLLVHTKMMCEKFIMMKSSFSKEIFEKGIVIYGKRTSE